MSKAPAFVKCTCDPSNAQEMKRGRKEKRRNEERETRERNRKNRNQRRMQENEQKSHSQKFRRTQANTRTHTHTRREEWRKGGMNADRQRKTPNISDQLKDRNPLTKTKTNQKGEREKKKKKRDKDRRMHGIRNARKQCTSRTLKIEIGLPPEVKLGEALSPAVLDPVIALWFN